jgi:hypothetical protein
MATVTKKALTAAPQRQIVKIHVKFTLNTPDGLRRVTFELEKDTQDDGSIDWKITFQLFERDSKTAAFGDPIVDLEVEVDSKLNSKAETMADDGMSTNQAAFAIGPAADTAKDPAVSDTKKQTTVQNTLKK